MIRFIKILIWVLIIWGWIFFWQYESFSSQTECIDTPEKIYFTVEKWDTYGSILEEKYNRPLFTKIYLNLNPPSLGLQAGKYEIQSCNNISSFIEDLQNPINETDISLTFLEWWNIFDIDEFLTGKWYISENDFISFAENHNLESDYVFLDGVSSLEWYLYPDTYALNPNNISPEIIARKMLDAFNTRIFQWYLVDADNETIAEIITLASIVEKEERNPDERPTVAGILSKRLDEWWQIGADITVCYPFRLTSEECKFSVTKYLYEVNDYNTRQKFGLPAGPIWNPSESSITAVLSPTDTPYYYYLHDTLTWEIYYGETNADHERNKALYLR